MKCVKKKPIIAHRSLVCSHKWQVSVTHVGNQAGVNIYTKLSSFFNKLKMKDLEGQSIYINFASDSVNFYRYI